MTPASLKKKLMFAGVVCIVGASCIQGGVRSPTRGQFPPAHQPQGVPSFLYLPGNSIQGELLAVERDALILLVTASPEVELEGRLARVPFNAISRAEFMFAGDVVADPDDYSPPSESLLTESLVAEGIDIAVDPSVRERLRLLARYPQGVGGELLARLDEAYGAMETLEPGGGG